MHLHSELGSNPFARKRNLYVLILQQEISLAGYCKAKIYGTLSCASGKRMRQENRVFFKDEAEALAAGYRPCGHCLPRKHKLWKAAQDQENLNGTF